MTRSVSLRAVPRTALSALATAGVFLLAGGMAQPARAFTASAGFHALVEAEDATATIGDVNDGRRIGDQPGRPLRAADGLLRQRVPGLQQSRGIQRLAGNDPRGS